jgi:hypothetical protein
MNTEKSEWQRAADLADRMKTYIPGGILRDFWSLPVLEKLLERIEELEKRADV